MYYIVTSVMSTAAASWGDLVREIEASKKSLPWQNSGIEPVRRVNLKDVKLKEREVDPILMQFRDVDREKRYQTMKREAATSHNKTSRGGNSMFALIGHVPQDPRPRPSKEDRNGSKYHILSKLTLDKHLHAPTLYDDEMVHKEIVASSQHRIRSKPVPMRRYNMLTNMYIENHEETTAQEREKLQRRIDEAFWKTHSFDPIRQTHYDPAVEEQTVAGEKLAETMQGQALRKKLPESIVHAEGYEYDIISLHSLIEGELRSVSLEQRQLSKIKGHGVEQQQRVRGEDEQMQAERRRLRRISDKRKETQIAHNLEPLPRALSVTSSWDRIQTSPSRVMEPMSQLTTARDDRSSFSSLSSSVVGPAQQRAQLATAPALDMTRVDFGEPVVIKKLLTVRTGGLTTRR